jgi:hypothetical protein
MHFTSSARHVLASLTAVAALAALPAAATAAHTDDGVAGAEQIEAELQQLRTVARADTTGGAQGEVPPLKEEAGAESVRTSRAGLGRRLTALRRAIEARQREALFPFRPRVVMSQVRVAADGDAQLRMACSDDAVRACRGIAWLTTEDGSLLGAGVFGVPAGEAKRVAWDMPAGDGRGRRRVVLRAAVRDASGAVWTNSRQLSAQI